MLTLPCTRCARLVELKITGDSEPIDLDYDYEEIEIGTKDHGMVTCVCEDCLTNAEMLQNARRSASALLDRCEEMVASLDMVAERLPAIKDDAKFQAQYAWAQEWMAKARVGLQKLLEIEPDDD